MAQAAHAQGKMWRDVVPVLRAVGLCQHPLWGITANDAAVHMAYLRSLAKLGTKAANPFSALACTAWSSKYARIMLKS